MKLRSPWIHRLAGFGISVAARTVMSTLDYRVAYYDPSVEPAWPPAEPCIFIQWHEYLGLMIERRPRRRCTVLVSEHSDGEVVRAAVELCGYDTIRGSSKRGGASALREYMELARKKHHVTITPDGPRGPRREMSLGPIYLASKLRLPIICFGQALDRPWRLNSWDKLAIPRPFSRARLVMGPKLYVPAKLDRDGLECERQRIEDHLNWLSNLADDWVASGARMRNEFPFLPWSQFSRRFQRLARLMPLEHLAAMYTEVPPATIKLPSAVPDEPFQAPRRRAA
jgi:lysophospholipid acyltransferase (LPLAT)-like uncharacterized protein